MLDRMYKSIADLLLARGAFKDDDYDVIVYGLDGVVFTILPKGATLVLGAIAGIFVPTVLFQVAEIPLQLQGGGFHARTHARCMLFTCLCWLAFYVLYTYIPFVAAFLMACAAYVIIWKFAPVENVNAPIPPTMRIRSRRFVRRYALIVILIACVVQFLVTCVRPDIGIINVVAGFIERYSVPKAYLLALSIVGFSMFMAQFSKNTVNAKYVKER